MPGPLKRYRVKGRWVTGYKRRGKKNPHKITKWNRQVDKKRGNKVGTGKYRHTHDRGRR